VAIVLGDDHRKISVAISWLRRPRKVLGPRGSATSIVVLYYLVVPRKEIDMDQDARLFLEKGGSTAEVEVRKKIDGSFRSS
jgi:hypothetical protein